MRRHGTQSSYCGGCRCADCTEGARAYHANRRAVKVADGFAGLTHGLIGTYSIGCRCDECREARRLYAHSNRSQKAYAVANQMAGAWLRENHPGEWRILLNQAKDEIRDGAA